MNISFVFSERDHAPLLPLYLKRVHDADAWLETRAIDSPRANSRLIKKALRLQERDDLATVMHVNGATITDNYLVKPLDSNLTYDDINFDNDYFSRLALILTSKWLDYRLQIC